MSLDALVQALDGITTITDPNVVRVKSKDFYWYSPVLKRTLDDKIADLVVSPTIRGGGRPGRAGVRTVEDAAHGARRRHRQLRPGDPAARAASSST